MEIPFRALCGSSLSNQIKVNQKSKSLVRYFGETAAQKADAAILTRLVGGAYESGRSRLFSVPERKKLELLVMNDG
jgi:hypothetical protein